jgi:AraC-like DNA-binding protein
MVSSAFPVFYFGHLSAVLEQQGIDFEKYLVAFGIEKQDFKTPQAAIPVAVFEQIMEKILALPQSSHLGLRVGKRLHIAHHGALGLAILNAPCLRSIVQVVVDFIVTRIPFIELSVQETSHDIRVLAHDLKWEREVHRFLVEVVAMAFINLQRAMNERGNNIVIRTVMLDYSDNNFRDIYLEAWQIETRFNQAFSGFVLSKDEADDPLVDSDVVSFEQAVMLCQQEKQLIVDNATTAGKVRHHFHTQLGHLPSLANTAESLALSQRTLHRELQKEGVSFSGLLDEWLARQAKEMLLARGLSVQQTADELGYAEVSNFRRAFKRWFGCSPSHYVKSDQRNGPLPV